MSEWLKSEGLTILLIAVTTYIFTRFSRIVVRKLVNSAIRNSNYASQQDEVRREDTLVSIISTSIKVIVWVLAAMLIISELGVQIGPLIAGAGVAGIALAFGAQSIVKDFISGIFIVLENQYRVGDVVELNGVSGVVKAITMRATVLRDLDGNVHHFPNGSIEHTTNKTMEYSKINLSIGVSYEDDIDRIEKVVNQVGSDLSQDPVWGSDIIKSPYFARISNFGESSVEIKIFGKTAPGKHWAVTGELRRRLKKAFDKAGIEIPFPQRVVHQAKSRKK